MTYRIVKREAYYAEYRTFLRWHPIIDPYMGVPAKFHTEDGAETFITRHHCNVLNARHDGKLSIEPRIRRSR